MKKVVLILGILILLTSCSNLTNREDLLRENFNRENLELSLEVYSKKFDVDINSCYLVNLYYCKRTEEVNYYVSEFRIIKDGKSTKYDDNLNEEDDFKEKIGDITFNYIDETRRIFAINEYREILTFTEMYEKSLVTDKTVEKLNNIHKLLYPNLYL